MRESIYKSVRLTDHNYDRINNYAKQNKISFNKAINQLMEMPEIIVVAPLIPIPPKPKLISKYESFALSPVPRRRKKSLNNQPR